MKRLTDQDKERLFSLLLKYGPQVILYVIRLWRRKRRAARSKRSMR